MQGESESKLKFLSNFSIGAYSSGTNSALPMRLLALALVLAWVPTFFIGTTALARVGQSQTQFFESLPIGETYWIVSETNSTKAKCLGFAQLQIASEKKSSELSMSGMFMVSVAGAKTLTEFSSHASFDNFGQIATANARISLPGSSPNSPPAMESVGELNVKLPENGTELYLSIRNSNLTKNISLPFERRIYLHRSAKGKVGIRLPRDIKQSFNDTKRSLPLPTVATSQVEPSVVADCRNYLLSQKSETNNSVIELPEKTLKLIVPHSTDRDTADDKIN